MHSTQQQVKKRKVQKLADLFKGFKKHFQKDAPVTIMTGTFWP